MRSSVFSFAGALLAFCVSFTTHAATVVFDGSAATAVLGLDVNGTSYDVTWEQGTFNGLGSGVFPFVGSLSEATDAEDALNLALTNAGATLFKRGNGTTFTRYDIAYALAGSALSTRQNGTIPNGSSNWEFIQLLSRGADQTVSYAVFTAVPIPAAVWLFGSALGVLGWIQRKRA